MHKNFIAIGALLAALAVALGAFGAHGLKKIDSEDVVQAFQTGVQYQMYHSLALILTGILVEKFPSKLTLHACRFFITGIILFSGSLYLLTAFKAFGIEHLNFVGIITPLGGIFFIIGWGYLFFSCLKNK